jgi:hypothetical protein
MHAYDSIMPRMYAYAIFSLPAKPEQEPRAVHVYLEDVLSKTVK